jgi:hypothetical protein
VAFDSTVPSHSALDGLSAMSTVKLIRGLGWSDSLIEVLGCPVISTFLLPMTLLADMLFDRGHSQRSYGIVLIAESAMKTSIASSSLDTLFSVGIAPILLVGLHGFAD